MARTSKKPWSNIHAFYYAVLRRGDRIMQCAALRASIYPYISPFLLSHVCHYVKNSSLDIDDPE